MELLYKRILWMSVLSAVFYFASKPLERHISNKLDGYEFLDHRLYYTSKELYESYDQLGFEHLRAFLVYQVVDVIRSFVFALLQVDVLTLGLRHVNALSSLDSLPFLAFVVNFAENGLLSYAAAKWPGRLVKVAKYASICTTLKSVVIYTVYVLLALSSILALYYETQSKPKPTPSTSTSQNTNESEEKIKKE
eukprot:TRINITY_DN10026_c0_g1_i1.p1 TRINITY_DN10026_c0_g1~~TRINITY_DN10026_c0_g1_i1.p1  ORF type:complete len:193 (-),score=23.47 TRINITY_DN10026_c0_g1_i1:5-583(-)